VIFLDSDVIIDFLKGKKEAVESVKRNKERIATTEINAFEILFGIYMKKIVSEREKFAASEFFESLEVLPLDEGCGKISAQILAALMKRGNTIDQNDCLIAAIILKNGFNKIITRNGKHFSRIKNLEVVGY